MILPPEIKRRLDYFIAWGGVWLHSAMLAPHFLIFGTTNAGKTLCVRIILGSALMGEGFLRGRCILYDGKREYYSMLRGIGVPDEQIYILNPADSRCAAWDLAGDIRNLDDAKNIVELLIPDDKYHHDNPFFPDAIRSLIVNVMMVLHEASPGKWKLHDVLNAIRTPRILQRVLDTTPEAREARERYFTEAKDTVGGIISTLDARFISVYETIARVWGRCSRSIRLTDWIKGNSAILLGYDANRSAVDRINQAISQRVAQLATSLPENAALSLGETWVVLDEIRFLGKMPMMPQLASFGRTKGVRVIMAPQDIDGVYAVYEEHPTNEMLGLCANVGVLHLDSSKTREWAAKFFGDYETWETDYGGSTTNGTSSGCGPGGASYSTSSSVGASWNRRIVKRESVLPSEFFGLPVTNRIDGMHGFFATPRIGAWRAAISPQFIDAHLPPNARRALPFIPRSEDALAPLRWSADEERRYTAIVSAPSPTLFDASGPPKLGDDKRAEPKKARATKKRSASLPSW